MITKTLKAGIFIIAVASFSFASAQVKVEPKSDKIEVKKHRSEKMFQHLDANADDVITLEEFKAKLSKDKSKEERLEKRFAELDTDQNGTLNREEYKKEFETERKLKQVRKQEKIEKKG